MKNDFTSIRQFHDALDRIREHAAELGGYGVYSELAGVIEDHIVTLSLEDSPTPHFLNAMAKSLIDCEENQLLDSLATLKKILEEVEDTLMKYRAS